MRRRRGASPEDVGTRAAPPFHLVACLSPMQPRCCRNQTSVSAELSSDGVCPQSCSVDSDRSRLQDEHTVATEVGSQQAESIGQRLRRLRTERRLSQRELSSPGVSYAYISRIEAGTRQPSVKALRMLARKLGVSAEYLETGREIGDEAQRELRLADAELRLRLDDIEGAEPELRDLLAESIQSGDTLAAARQNTALG